MWSAPTEGRPTCTCITIGGNHICHPGNVGSNTAYLELFKLVVNSLLSRPGTKCSYFDAKNFYLRTLLDRPEYVRIKMSAIPQEFTNKYDLTRYARDDLVYFEICKIVYGLS